jgi:hypothetical protein
VRASERRAQAPWHKARACVPRESCSSPPQAIWRLREAARRAECHVAVVFERGASPPVAVAIVASLWASPALNLQSVLAWCAWRGREWVAGCASGWASLSHVYADANTCDHIATDRIRLRFLVPTCAATKPDQSPNKRNSLKLITETGTHDEGNRSLQSIMRVDSSRYVRTQMSSLRPASFHILYDLLYITAGTHPGP